MTVYSYLITILKNYNKSIDDIQWIGCKDFQIVKDNFFAYIQEKEYRELKEQVATQQGLINTLLKNQVSVQFIYMLILINYTL